MPERSGRIHVPNNSRLADERVAIVVSTWQPVRAPRKRIGHPTFASAPCPSRGQYNRTVRDNVSSRLHIAPPQTPGVSLPPQSTHTPNSQDQRSRAPDSWRYAMTCASTTPVRWDGRGALPLIFVRHHAGTIGTAPSARNPRTGRSRTNRSVKFLAGRSLRICLGVHCAASAAANALYAFLRIGRQVFVIEATPSSQVARNFHNAIQMRRAQLVSPRIRASRAHFPAACDRGNDFDVVCPSQIDEHLVGHGIVRGRVPLLDGVAERVDLIVHVEVLSQENERARFVLAAAQPAGNHRSPDRIFRRGEDLSVGSAA